jgi:hypothetical protein
MPTVASYFNLNRNDGQIGPTSILTVGSTNTTTNLTLTFDFCNADKRTLFAVI